MLEPSGIDFFFLCYLSRLDYFYVYISNVPAPWTQYTLSIPEIGNKNTEISNISHSRSGRTFKWYWVRSPGSLKRSRALVKVYQGLHI